MAPVPRRTIKIGRERGPRMSARRQPVAVDLFSGAGGLTHGLKAAGFHVAAAVELETLAAATYRANHPEVELWTKDIRKLPVVEVMRKLRLKSRELDLLAGCPPCEGFSSIRTRNGGRRIRDQRNNLVFEFLRFVRVLQPKVVMMENVPALKDNWRMRRVTRTLRALGYSIEIRVLDASNYGVPQRRRRMVLLAGRFGPVDFGRRSTRRRTVRDAIGPLATQIREHDALHNTTETRSARIKRLIASIPKDGGSRASLPPEEQLPCHSRMEGFYDVYGRMAWDDVAPTITGGCVNPSKGRFLHPSRDRAITLREAACLQTFPLSYIFVAEGGKYATAEMIGNALPPRFSAAHARAIFRYLSAGNQRLSASSPRGGAVSIR